MRVDWIATTVAVALAAPAAAQVVVPIPVAGYNQDVIAGAGGTAMATTTASFDAPAAGLNDNVLYQRGYNTAAPAVGVPATGLIVTSATRSYQLGPIAGNNSLQMNDASQQGTLTLLTPARYSALSMLLAEGSGVQPGNGGRSSTVDVAWSDGQVVPHSYTVYDWFLLLGPPGPNSGVAINNLDRARRDTGVVQNSVPNPVLYYFDVDLTADPNYVAGAAVQGITVHWPGQAGIGSAETTNVMGLSGVVAAVPEPSSLALAGLAGCAACRWVRRDPRLRRR